MDDAQTPARPVLPSERNEVVSLREFEQRLHTLHRMFDERTRYEREILESRSQALDEALKIASAEIARRLEELNHAHANAIQNWRQSLPREVFEATVAEWSRWRDTVNTHMTLMVSVPQSIVNVDTRIKAMETLANKISGAMILIAMMGFAGVMSLALALLRMAGFIH